MNTQGRGVDINMLFNIICQSDITDHAESLPTRKKGRKGRGHEEIHGITEVVKHSEIPVA
jgi:hypothetical protein